VDALDLRISMVSMSESVRWFQVLVSVVGLAACGYPPLQELGGGVSDAPSGDSNTSPKACNDRPGIFFCDGFESANLDAWSEHYGNVMRQTTTVHSGTGALYAAGSSSSSPVSAGVGFQLSSPIQTGSLHFRAWFYASMIPSAGKVHLFQFDGLTKNGVAFLVDQGMINVYSEPTPSTTITTSEMLQPNQWYCVEVHVDTSASNDAVRIELNGVQIGSSGTAPIAPPNGGYAGLSAGLPYLINGDAQIYVDDVSAGTQPIGCM
jgi:hypothetical protein